MKAPARELGPQNVFMDRFVLEAKTQRVWRGPHAAWFTLMGVGGGLFIVTRLFGQETRVGSWVGASVSDVVSFVAIAAGGLILIADLGRPMRFVRAVRNPRTSWISRGAIADFVFLGAGILLVLPALRLAGARPFGSLPWDAGASDVGGKALEWVALVAAAVVTFYAGQVLASPRAIPYWHSAMIPAQWVLSSLSTSTAVLIVMEWANGASVPAWQPSLEAGLLAGLLAAIAWHATRGADTPGKRESVEALLRGRYRSAFIGGVVVAGTALPLVLSAIGALAGSSRPAIGLATLVLLLPAGYALRLLTLRVGIFPPVRSLVPVR